MKKTTKKSPEQEAGHKWRLHQAEELCRELGYVEDPEHPGAFITREEIAARSHSAKGVNR